MGPQEDSVWGCPQAVLKHMHYVLQEKDQRLYLLKKDHFIFPRVMQCLRQCLWNRAKAFDA